MFSAKIILENAKLRNREALTAKILQRVEESEENLRKRQETAKNCENPQKLPIFSKLVSGNSQRFAKDKGKTAKTVVKFEEDAGFSEKTQGNQGIFKENERISAKVFEKGAVIDINEGFRKKVKTFFLLKHAEDLEICDLKERKKEFINKYSRFINENINENIRGINEKLQQLAKKQKKVQSFHL